MSLTDLVASPSYRATRGRVPVFRPLLNGEEFDVVVTEAVFMLGVNAHEMATLNCTSATLTTTDGMLNSTISFFYGQAPRTELFQGYVLNVTQTSGTGALAFGLLLLGPTKVLQTGQPRFWVNKSVPSALKDIANTNLLGVITHPHTFIWKSLAQTDESDLTMLRSLANRLGWAVFSRYGVLLCWDPYKLFTEQGSYATLQASQDQDFDVAAERRLIDFTPQEASEENPDNMGKKIAYFTDNNQVQVTTEKGVHAKYKFVTNFVIRNAEEAEIYANADEAEDSWKQQATARIWGDTDIYPGMNVDVVTANPTYVRSKFDGRWLVVKVQHKMDTSQFQTQLSLIRPSNKTPTRQEPYESFWVTAGRPKPSLSLEDEPAPDSPSITTRQRWVSSWTDPTVRSIQ